MVTFHFLVEILLSLHGSMAHIGRHKLLQTASQLVWHPDLYRVANEVCVTCLRCQLFKVSHQPLTPPVVKIETTSPFELVSVDLIDFPRSNRGYKTVLMVVDHFSKWLVSVPLKDKKGESVARALEQWVLPVLPRCPRRLLSDNGPEFRSEIFKGVLRKFDIVHTFSTPYCPSSNGGVERANRTIAEMLRGLSSDQTNWDLRLSHAVMVYNATLHRALGMSPSSCLLSQAHDLRHRPLLPSDVRDVWRAGHPRFLPFSVGQKVLYRNHQPGNLTLNKLKPKFSGPFSIVRVFQNGVTYVIRQDLVDGGSLTKSAHYRQLKLYHEPPAYLSEHPCFQRFMGQPISVEGRARGGFDSDSDEFRGFLLASESDDSGLCGGSGAAEVSPVEEQSVPSDRGPGGSERGTDEARELRVGRECDSPGSRIVELSKGTVSFISPDSFRSCPGLLREGEAVSPRGLVSDGCLMTRGRHGRRRKNRHRVRAPLRVVVTKDLSALPCSERVGEDPFSSTFVGVHDVPIEGVAMERPVLEVSGISLEAGSVQQPLEGESSVKNTTGLDAPVGEGAVPAVVVGVPADGGAVPADGGAVPADGVAVPADGVDVPADTVDVPGPVNESCILAPEFLGFGAGGSLDSSGFDGFTPCSGVTRLRDLKRIIEDARLTIAENRRRSLSRQDEIGPLGRLSMSPRVELPLGRMQTRSCGPKSHVHL